MSEKQKETQNDGLVPPNEEEATLWNVLCIDLIGPNNIRRKR